MPAVISLVSFAISKCCANEERKIIHDDCSDVIDTKRVYEPSWNYRAKLWTFFRVSLSPPCEASINLSICLPHPTEIEGRRNLDPGTAMMRMKMFSLFYCWLPMLAFLPFQLINDNSILLFRWNNVRLIHLSVGLFLLFDSLQLHERTEEKRWQNEK